MPSIIPDVDRADVIAFAAQYGTAAAAQRWSINQRTVRKWRDASRRATDGHARANTQSNPPQSAPSLSSQPAIVTGLPAPVAPQRIYTDAPAKQTARGHELWRCSTCEEYLHPLPGEYGPGGWICYLCATRPAAPPTEHASLEDERPGPAHRPTALPSGEARGPERPTAQVQPATHLQRDINRERPMRGPEPQTTVLLRAMLWAEQHPAASKQMAALMALMALIFIAFG